MEKVSPQIKVAVLSEEGVLFEGKADCLFVPTARGEVAILPYHMPMVLLMKSGSVKVVSNHQRKKIVEVKKGVVRVDDNQAYVLVNL